MLFNSWTFALFLVIVLLCHRGVWSWRWRKQLLLLFSYLFYGWWNPPFTLLLIFSTWLDFRAAAGIFRSRSRSGRLLWLSFSLLGNLGPLVFFKYGHFLAANFARLTQILPMGWTVHPTPWDIVLPIGISFYTFQTLSYTLDVYRGRAQPTPDGLDYALYVTFFPQLVAGPIVRSNDFLWQCQNPPRVSAHQFFWGIFLVAWGLFKKIVLADALCAPLVEEIFAKAGHCGVKDGWLGVYGFAVQLYCDFSGYSDIAIGLALMLGFHLRNNFNRPYGALSFSDFWTRWHISLSTLIRDHLYIPLGGNRKGDFRTLANIMITMFIGGLWHGARWTYVLWGGLHGLFLCGERLMLSKTRKSPEQFPRAMQILLWLLVFQGVCLSFVFFRSESVSGAFRMFGVLWGFGPWTTLAHRYFLRSVLVGSVAGLLAGWHLISRHRSLEDRAAVLPAWALGCLAGFLFFASRFLGGTGREFIYFQF